MTDERTVYDVVSRRVEVQEPLRSVLRSLGIDPDMPFEQLARWLRYGKKADELGPCRDGRDDFHRGWHACRDAIKGDDRWR